MELFGHVLSLAPDTRIPTDPQARPPHVISLLPIYVKQNKNEGFWPERIQTNYALKRGV